METLRHSVHAVSGHYGVPAPVNTLQVKHSFAYVPFSTVYGYLESLMGLNRGEFQGSIAIGVLHPAQGHGKILKKSYVMANLKQPKKTEDDASSEQVEDKKLRGVIIPRPIIWETYYDVGYQIAVRGSVETINRLKEALQGNVERFGILSLGTSDDEVYDITTGSEAAYWIVPGKAFLLPVESQEGWGKRTPQYGKFTLSAEKTEAIPEEAWLNLRA